MAFKKGQSGNPAKKFTKENQPLKNGRPKKLPALDELMAKVLGDEVDGKTKAEQILDSLIREAKKGNTKAAEILLDRGFGKVRQGVDVTSNGNTIGAVIGWDGEEDNKANKEADRSKEYRPTEE